MFQAPAPAENPAEFQRIMQIPRNSPTQSANHAKFAQIANLLLCFRCCFRCLTGGRELPEIPANQAKFAQFAHIFRELREFRTLRTKVYPYLVNFQISSHRQRTLENWSKSTRFRTVHPQPPQTM